MKCIISCETYLVYHILCIICMIYLVYIFIIFRPFPLYIFLSLTTFPNRKCS